MVKKIIRAGVSKAEAKKESDAINKNMAERGIKRESYVCKVSQSYVKKRTRKGYPVKKQNYGVCMRDKK